jgi:glucose/arabinose dehydrogenase
MKEESLSRFSILSSSFFILVLSVLCACQGQQQPGTGKEEKTDTAGLNKQYDLGRISLPEGFRIDVFAEVPGARSMCIGTRGTVFVGTMKGLVYAVSDSDKNGLADRVDILATGLNSPNGVAFKDGSLYVAEISRIIRFDSIEEHLQQPPPFKVVYDKYPTDALHGWKFIAFGPDGKLYVPVGAPCNVCEPENPVYASITRMNPDGTGFEIFAKGVRNTVGFTWNPDTKDMWFTENGRDNLGDDMPSDELNIANKPGMHFGFPYCHQGDSLDPEFGKGKNCADYTGPALRLGAHVASLGLRFYKGDMFPGYKNQVFIAEHGSWNRTKPSGYRIVSVKVENNKPVDFTPFATGWLTEGEQATGRPVDVENAPDGALLVSDDKQGVIYRISYKK